MYRMWVQWRWDWMAGFRFSVGHWEVSLHHSVQIYCGSDPVSYPKYTGRSYLGVKAGGTWRWPRTLISVCVGWMAGHAVVLNAYRILMGLDTSRNITNSKTENGSWGNRLWRRWWMEVTEDHVVWGYMRQIWVLLLDSSLLLMLEYAETCFHVVCATSFRGDCAQGKLYLCSLYTTTSWSDDKQRVVVHYLD